MSELKLRDYQERLRAAVLREWQSVRSTLVVAPTGTGKTVLFASIIESMRPARAMVIAHREELIWQARDKIERLTGLECEIEMADLRARTGELHRSPVTISTVQTQCSINGERRRMGRFKPEDYGLLIIDEAHHSAAQTYRDLVNYYTQNPALRVLGVTATPDRADEKALGEIFETVADDYEILDAINDGWLVSVRQQMALVGSLDFSHVRTTAGDLNGADLAAVMEAEQNIQGVVQPSVEAIFGLPPHALTPIEPANWPQYIQDNMTAQRRAIVFTASVRQAEALSNIFNRINPHLADWVCAKTKKEDRRILLKGFTEGSPQVVVNCGVLTEGFDDAGVELIVMAKPTKSRSHYAQMCGRAMRPLPGLVDGLPGPEERRAAIAASRKPACIILDFVGNSGRHKLMTSADILGGKVSEAAINRVIERAKHSSEPVLVDEALLEEERKIREETLERRRQEEARKARLVARVPYTLKNVNPFNVFDLAPVKTRGWDEGKQLSEKQRLLLLRQGVDPDSMSYAESRQLINEMFRRWDAKQCSLRQAVVLKRFGLPVDVTRDTASQWIDKIAKNHWKKPPNL